ncbi:MAG: sn-glycerol-3-phosphate ABC transporter ATP-binding protein UgpC [Thermodesulfobacteriota bacterium]|nr:sn-glycerol-3-phosphate ABC transporter ATP-binding protein UgpC [Thermodesulfobacteriota bacterium]
MASLTLKSISKSYGGAEVLSGVDLEVKDGEFCVLLGPSGCGKSTLLNIIAGLVPQDRGSVQCDGESVDHLSPRERDVAVVFQNYALYPHMTVAGNMGFGLRMRGVPKKTIRKRIAETADLLGIEDLLDRKPRELSGGQRQRVAMGRALVRRPKIFLFDEPLSNLDARLRSNVRLELKQLHQQIKGTMIYVTHDQIEAMTLGEKVVVMRQGIVQQVGDPETIYGKPANPFVAAFIGTPQINLYQGRFVYDDGVSFKAEAFSLNLQGLGVSCPDGEGELGIRPEDIVVVKRGQGPLEAHVDMISNIGSEKYVHAFVGREKITFRASKESDFDQGQGITLAPNIKRLHLFCQGKRV